MKEAREGETPTEFAIRMVKEQGAEEELRKVLTDLEKLVDASHTPESFKPGLKKAIRHIKRRLQLTELGKVLTGYGDFSV